MNSKTKNSTVFPQTEAIPQPLEVHPSVSPLAAELLMKTAEKLAKSPSCYNQQEPCGSVCCIIGHMEIILAGKHLPFYDDSLGLTNTQYHRIFEYSQETWGKLYSTDRAFAIPASVGIARIEHMLRTGQ